MGRRGAPVTGLGGGRRSPLAALAGGIRDLLLPPACAVCRTAHAPRRGEVVCPRCQAGIVPLAWPQCGRCGHPRGGAPVAWPGAAALPPCRWCERWPAVVRAVRSVGWMEPGTAGVLVHALKYEGWTAVATTMARAMARLEWPEDVVAERTALVPMPLSPARERERGYNQAERLASALSAAWGLPVWSWALRRVRHTDSQVRLTPSQRVANVSGAFAVPREAGRRLAGAHVVLVDDVVTTGATAAAAAEALVAGGARIASVVTFGRAPDPGDAVALDFDSDRT